MFGVKNFLKLKVVTVAENFLTSIKSCAIGADGIHTTSISLFCPYILE